MKRDKVIKRAKKWKDPLIGLGRHSMKDFRKKFKESAAKHHYTEENSWMMGS